MPLSDEELIRAAQIGSIEHNRERAQAKIAPDTAESYLAALRAVARAVADDCARIASNDKPAINIGPLGHATKNFTGQNIATSIRTAYGVTQ